MRKGHSAKERDENYDEAKGREENLMVKQFIVSGFDIPRRPAKDATKSIEMGDREGDT